MRFFVLCLAHGIYSVAAGPDNSITTDLGGLGSTPAAGVTTEADTEKDSPSTNGITAAFSEARNNLAGGNAADTALHNAIAESVQGGSEVGALRFSATPSGLECKPDAAKCPVDWERKGNLCFAPSSYDGPCRSDLDVFSLSTEQRAALGNACHLDYECLEPGQEAPQFRSHSYVDICPKGWTLQFGDICSAPATYRGPCGPTIKMDKATTMDKKRVEAYCDVEYPGAEISDCPRDYNAACPSGWVGLRNAIGETVCNAPATYRLCSPIQKFTQFSANAKKQWEESCQQKFPCT